MLDASVGCVLFVFAVFLLYHFMNRCDCNGFSVGGGAMDGIVGSCSDVATSYQPLCGLLRVPSERCSDYYTKSNGKGYFCLKDSDSWFYPCIQDEEPCPDSKKIEDSPQWMKFNKEQHHLDI